jgi:hypothetical protein
MKDRLERSQAGAPVQPLASTWFLIDHGVFGFTSLPLRIVLTSGRNACLKRRYINFVDLNYHMIKKSIKNSENLDPIVSKTDKPPNIVIFIC